jgi:hypothetical protein
MSADIGGYGLMGEEMSRISHLRPAADAEKIEMEKCGSERRVTGNHQGFALMFSLQPVGNPATLSSVRVESNAEVRTAAGTAQEKKAPAGNHRRDRNSPGA